MRMQLILLNKILIKMTVIVNFQHNYKMIFCLPVIIKYRRNCLRLVICINKVFKYTEQAKNYKRKKEEIVLTRDLNQERFISLILQSLNLVTWQLKIKINTLLTKELFILNLSYHSIM